MNELVGNEIDGLIFLAIAVCFDFGSLITAKNALRSKKGRSPEWRARPRQVGQEYEIVVIKNK